MAPDIMLAQVTVIILSFIVSANSLVIDVQPELIHPNEGNVSITCAGGRNSTKILEKMLRIRLMKLDDDDQWAEVAVLRFDGSIIFPSANATAVGRLGDVFHSNLVVTWALAPNDIHGRYRCDATALTSSGDVITEYSRDFDVKSRPSDLRGSSDFSSKRLQISEERLVGKVNETMHSALKAALHSMFGDLKEYLDNRTAVIVSTKGAEAEVKTMQWPEGSFMLLMPSNGCPLHPPAWNKGFVKIKAPPNDKYYPINVPLHLANPHQKNGFIYRQFCTLSSSSDRITPWPFGNYCVFQSSDCPSGFKLVQAALKHMADPANFYLIYSGGGSQYGGQISPLFRFDFCCRNDGHASIPIELPVSHPFYLVRNKGRCQEVKGMDVTQDVFMLETVDDGSSDKWVDDKPSFRPDISFRPYKENLCYYSRRRD